MPKQLAYLYDNTIPIYFDSGIGNEYRRQEKMYERLLKFYKGINNEVQFQFYNHDNKKVNIGQHTIKFNLLPIICGYHLREYGATQSQLNTGRLHIVFRSGA